MFLFYVMSDAQHQFMNNNNNHDINFENVPDLTVNSCLQCSNGTCSLLPIDPETIQPCYQGANSDVQKLYTTVSYIIYILYLHIYIYIYI
jgi:hypothetical protein